MSLGEINQNRISMRFEYVRAGRGKDEIVARGEQEIACMRRDGDRLGAVPPPAELREALRRYEVR
jgi:enediyne biosynthesis thioesterase